jgi:predicted cupin superfamily sugar epimerase
MLERRISMPRRLTTTEIIDLLGLAPLAGEGGYYRQTVIVPNAGPDGFDAPLHTAILFLVTPESWSGLHMLESDELFHFYMGDECRMVVCSPDGALEERRIGTDLDAGCRVQTMVPAGMWQGTRLVEDAEYGYALLGTTMTPGFRQDQFRLAHLADLALLPPAVAATLSEFLSPGT